MPRSHWRRCAAAPVAALGALGALALLGPPRLALLLAPRRLCGRAPPSALAA